MASTSNSATNHDEQVPLDLIGSPFAVIESDPGVFTNLLYRLGIRNLEVVEMYDLDDLLQTRGLIFCFRWRKDEHTPADFEDLAAERVWFANQLSDDACASLAILNVLLNCPDVDVGTQLSEFRTDTEKMSPVMKGLAISNSPHIRDAHNALARPADISAARNVRANAVSEQLKAVKRASLSKPAKRQKLNDGQLPSSKATDDLEETYHFIGYLPAYGKVWELDGLKSGPLEVGELPNGSDGGIAGWMDIARPAIRMKMRKYGADAERGDIRFNLLAIVDDQYPQASDSLEFLRRDRIALERKLNEYDPEWEAQVDKNLLLSADQVFTTRACSSAFGKTYAPDFASRRLDRDLVLIQMSFSELVSAWEKCVQSAISAKVDLEDILTKDMQDNSEHIKRTHDYSPFIREFITELHNLDLLDSLVKKKPR